VLTDVPPSFDGGAAVAFDLDGPAKAPKSLADSFCCSSPFQPNAHTALLAPCGPHAIPAYIPDPPGPALGGFF
jgi:hypothetical protein